MGTKIKLINTAHVPFLAEKNPLILRSIENGTLFTYLQQKNYISIRLSCSRFARDPLKLDCSQSPILDTRTPAAI